LIDFFFSFIFFFSQKKQFQKNLIII